MIEYFSGSQYVNSHNCNLKIERESTSTLAAVNGEEWVLCAIVPASRRRWAVAGRVSRVLATRRLQRAARARWVYLNAGRGDWRAQEDAGAWRPAHAPRRRQATARARPILRILLIQIAPPPSA